LNSIEISHALISPKNIQKDVIGTEYQDDQDSYYLRMGQDLPVAEEHVEYESSVGLSTVEKIEFLPEIGFLKVTVEFSDREQQQIEEHFIPREGIYWMSNIQ